MANGGRTDESGGQRVDVSQTAQGRSRGWWVYQGTGQPLDPADRDRRWPKPPPWRSFSGGPDLPAPPPDETEARRRLGTPSIAHSADPAAVSMINAAIFLSRPLIVTGRPGSGKSSLAHMLSRELGLGRVLRWSITSRSTLRLGLYEYDAFGHAQALGSGEDTNIGNFIHLGPLGTALLPNRLPRVLLIDELDKSDVDLPNDLLSVFEEGEFPVNELVRVRDRLPEVSVHTADPGVKAPVLNGVIQCHAFPIVVITSNGEREFPAAFMRRCLTLSIPDPDRKRLAEMVAAHFDETTKLSDELVSKFVADRKSKGVLAADQLLNAIHLATSGAFVAGQDEGWTELLNAIWHRLEAPA
jgi:MoxR-like ATPase